MLHVQIYSGLCLSILSFWSKFDWADYRGGKKIRGAPFCWVVETCWTWRMKTVDCFFRWNQPLLRNKAHFEEVGVYNCANFIRPTYSLYFPNFLLCLHILYLYVIFCILYIVVAWQMARVGCLLIIPYNKSNREKTWDPLNLYFNSD